ncbi:Plus-end-directed kinesin ATPase protein [Dioscorea alata]|uniref:Plus-end-directed kinesin ATPase protein n=1 Tax=Dioscorea alata TaxID=55571 RepID=A0ACB7TYY0_DIOAL|nr:Plus-end-directed kinesin ATPase protein [Dioscorea alata]
MNRMPAVSEPGSAIRSRLRFQDLSSGAESVPMELGGRDSDGDREAPVVAGSSGEGFELQEDPSFLKDNNVQVVIRIRPLSGTEISLQGNNKCVRQDNCQTITWTGHPESRFTFDLVADENVSQEKLFKVAGVPMVENCMAGYNSCMFAYGQTGSGKTHTMLGDIEGGTRRHSVNCGMTPRVFEYLFSRIQKEKDTQRDEKLQFTCKCSFLEIYNEQILDLLDPSSANLQIREDARKGVYVENLTEFEVSSARDVLQQLVQGAANRKVASTNMNRASSRSHSVFTCVIESKWESQGITHHRFARLNLVDLAGSERQKSSGAEGDRLKEATNINKSLSTLGLVIMNLVSSSKKSLHVPYRDSKLTFLLQDSLGGNSKTTIIANISPSNCCGLETLSTLKFAQRAKFIRNNAIINEDASGDVLTLRLQIQQLKKEVNRLRNLVNDVNENQESESKTACSAGSPGIFKWDGGQGSFSPLTFDKRLSQRKEYEAVLAAAFRRDREKEVTLKAMAAEKQAAEQLATQRTEEVQSLKMRLRFREERIRRLEAVASGKLAAEAHLLQEKEEILKEIEVLRNQVDRNPEVTRFAMENLRLKEELRRLQSFVEEGEREMMKEQITVLQDKLLEALDWKLMHEKESVQDLTLTWDSAVNEENELLHLQAIQNQREVEALRKNLNFCLEAKEKLERRVDDLESQLEERRKTTNVPAEASQEPEITEPNFPEINSLSDDQIELKTMVDAIAMASQREAEAHETAIILAKENEELRMKLKDLIEDNNKLIELYESTAAGCTGKQAQDTVQVESNEGQKNIREEFIMHDDSSHQNLCSDTRDVGYLENQLREMHEENEKLMVLYENAMQERDEFKRMFFSNELMNVEPKQEICCPEKLVEMDQGNNDQNLGHAEPEEHTEQVEASEEKLQYVQTKLCEARLKVVTSADAIRASALLENGTVEVDQLLQKCETVTQDLQSKQEEFTALKLALSEKQERKAVIENKLLAAKSAMENFSSKSHYWEEREFHARARVEACSKPLATKKEELMRLQMQKEEIDAAYLRARQCESDFRSSIDLQKSRFRDAETQRKETERVLFAIDNLDNSEAQVQRGMHFGKASELLKSEEERIKISSDLKQLREKLLVIQKQVSNFRKSSEALDTEIQSLEAGMKSELILLEEAKLGLEKATKEKEMLSEMRQEGLNQLGQLLVEYQECIFESDLKEGEIELCQEEIKQKTADLEDLRLKRRIAVEKLNEMISEKRFNYQKVEEGLRDVEMSLSEAIIAAAK